MDWLLILIAIFVAQTPAPGSATGWQTALEGFDTIRATAFERDAPELLGLIYPADSRLLKDDLRLLGGYRDRRIQIESMHMQIERLSILQEDRSQVRLSVVDRLILTKVVLPDGSKRALPRDRLTRHTVQLQLTPAGWRISSVQP